MLSLFMITKIQNLNGTHNHLVIYPLKFIVVYDYKDTKFEWNSQRGVRNAKNSLSCL